MEEQVTLEAYADQNRALIHNQRNNEALAICKHILRYFPKHLETYRQMGEAYLNLGDLDSAKDMFRRVLSADPEDLVAYIGLSTVFEQQRLYEETIWHLERAYELAPENIEIQKELLRLYPEIGVRIQQRVQMTSSILARLYIHEGLYPQAIQELKGILAQSPTRFDANVALAETLWNAGRLREAADVSEKLLAALPYCLKANLILGTVWKESGVPEGDLHLQRAQEVDPTNRVAQQVLGARSTLPVLQITVPRYVEGAASSSEQPTTTPTQPVASDQETWFTETSNEKSDSLSRTPSLFDAQPTPAETAQATTDESTLTEDEVAGLPDWLTTELTPSSETSETTAAESKDQAQPIGTSEIEQVVAAEPFSSSEQETPEWLKGWQVVPEEPAPITPVAESTPTSTVEPTPAQELPDWLHGLEIAEETTPTATGEPPAETGEKTPDWLQGLETTQETEPAETVEPLAEAAEETPEWLRGLQLADKEPSAPVAEEKPIPAKEPVPDVPFEWTGTPTAKQAPEPSDEKSFADFLSNLGQEPTPPSEPTSSTDAVPDFFAGLPTPVESEPPSATDEYRLPSFLDETQPAASTLAELPTPSDELPLTDFLASPLDEEKISAPSEAYPLPTFLDTQEPIAPSEPPAPDWLTSPTEEMFAPEMPPTPRPIDTAPSIVVETPTPILQTRKPKRAPKGAERLAQARQYRDANEIDKALVEYDYIVQRAPRLVKEVIDDLEVLVQPLDAPLEAHRILGDAYTRADRLNDALERYHFVMDHSPKAGG